MYKQSRIERIVLFRGDIETLGFFSEQLAKAFEEKGYLTLLFDYREPEESIPKLADFCRESRTAVVTFNYIGLIEKETFTLPNGKVIWDEIKAPCYNIVVDHPFYYDKHLKEVPKDYFQFCIDREHVRYMKRFYPEIRTEFLPLAGTQWSGSDTSFEDREIDILFVGNYTRPETFEKHITRINDEYTAFYRRIIQDLIEHPQRTIEEVAEEHMHKEMEESLTDEDIRTSISNMIFIDLYVRFYFRGKVLQTLVDSGLKVHVFGVGWDLLECRKPENLIDGFYLTSEGCLEQMGRAKISLNVMPWFKDGAHDRIFNAMLNHSVCVTDESVFLKEHFEDKKEVCFYSLEQIEKLPGEIKRLLASPEKLKEISQCGYQKAKKEDEWRSRAEKILSYI